MANLLIGNRILEHRFKQGTLVEVTELNWYLSDSGVYFEKVLKKSSVDLWMQNIRLSMMGMPFSAITMLVSDYDKIRDCQLLPNF
jgi:hypothetical protein